MKTHGSNRIEQIKAKLFSIFLEKMLINVLLYFNKKNNKNIMNLI